MSLAFERGIISFGNFKDVFRCKTYVRRKSFIVIAKCIGPIQTTRYATSVNRFV